MTIKKNALLFCALAVSAAAQNTTVNVTMTVPSALVADAVTHYLSQTSQAVGFTTAALDATTTSATLSLCQTGCAGGGLSSAPQMLTGAPTAVLIAGTEPCLVTGFTTGAALINGSTVPVVATIACTRGGFAPLAAMSAHASGAAVAILRYPSFGSMLGAEALLPWAAFSGATVSVSVQ